jgi:hypothetical protein
MNANELADYLEKCDVIDGANMIRQLQAEKSNLMELVDIQKAVSRDVDIDFLNLTINQQQAEIKELKQQVAFLEDWRDTWSPTIKQLMNINVKVNDE